MISHCANRDCAVPFRHFRGGRLYRFDLKQPSAPCADVPNAICSAKPSRASVFFWLCEECSAKYSLRFNFREGITLVPLLSSSAGKASIGPVVLLPPTP